MFHKLKSENIHLFSQRGSYYSFSNKTLKTHILTPLEHKLLNAVKNNNTNEFLKIQRENDIILISRTLEKFSQLYEAQGTDNSNRKQSIGSEALSSIELNMVQDCNMMCKYCIVNHGTFNEESGYLTEEQAEASIDMLISSSKTIDECTVIFFGGEPLMNFETIKHVVLYAESKAKAIDKKMRYWIITNGTLFNEEVLQFILSYNINIEISIDGAKAVHDYMRTFKDGKGTYDCITNMIPSLHKISDCNIRPRATVTAQNTDIKAIIDHLRSLGFKNPALEMVGGEGSEYAFDETSMEQLKSSLIELSELFLHDLPQGELRYGALFLPFLFKLAKAKPAYNYCTAGISKLAVSVHGEVYPCKYFVGLPEYKVGSLETGIIEQQLENFIIRNTIFNRPKCTECWARFVCGGGCAAAAAQINGNIDIPYEKRCVITKFIIELSIRILSEFRDKHPLLYSDPFFMMYLSKAAKQ